jgi:hypothetical protein
MAKLSGTRRDVDVRFGLRYVRGSPGVKIAVGAHGWLAKAILFMGQDNGLQWRYRDAILRNRIKGCLVDVEMRHNQFRRRMG